MKYQELKSKTLKHYCRRCINKMYGLKLKPQDCIYLEYKYECNGCQTMQNIVYDIRKSSRIKLLFGKEREVL